MSEWLRQLEKPMPHASHRRRQLAKPEVRGAPPREFGTKASETTIAPHSHVMDGIRSSEFDIGLNATQGSSACDRWLPQQCCQEEIDFFTASCPRVSPRTRRTGYPVLVMPARSKARATRRKIFLTSPRILNRPPVGESNARPYGRRLNK